MMIVAVDVAVAEAAVDVGRRPSAGQSLPAEVSAAVAVAD